MPQAQYGQGFVNDHESAETSSADESSEEDSRSHMQRYDELGTEKWRIIWFVAALLSLINSLVGVFVIGRVRMEPVHIMELLYTCLFSLMLMIQAWPCKTSKDYYNDHGRVNCMDSFRADIEKYFHFLYRFTYKGLFFVYLGSSDISYYCMSPVPETTVVLGSATTPVPQTAASSPYKWVGITVGIIIILVGLLTMVKGIRLTSKLSGLKQAAALDQTFPRALTPQDFYQFATEKRQVDFTPSEIRHIFKGMQPNAPNVLSANTVDEWRKGKMTMGMGVL